MTQDAVNVIAIWIVAILIVIGAWTILRDYFSTRR